MSEPKKRINHVVFNVHDLDESVKFYTEVVGMKLIRRFDDRKMAFVSFGDRHHDIGLFQVGGTPERDRQWHGFNHLAMEYEGGPEILDDLHRRLIDKDAKMDNLEGHAGGRHKSVYFFDPDGNRLEFYWENPSWRAESAQQVKEANDQKKT
jgi:catechol 2,3-dioxygenase-like lactoylglutathione lyase family enzyme